jgi:hypothetical protein
VTSRRVLAHIAFAFLLLFSQQLGTTHVISHLSSDFASSSSQQKQLPNEMQCDQCLAFAAIGSGLIGSPPSIPHFAASTTSFIEALLVKPLPAEHRAFDSRAPPSQNQA